VALAALATFGRRRGPVRPALPEQRTSVLEFVDALGALYRRARAASGAVEVSLQRTRRVLAGLTGLAPTAPDEQMAEAAATRLNLPASQIVSALRAGEQAAGNPGLKSRDALDVVRALQSLSTRAEGHAGARTHHDRRPEPDARGA
jgi:hypothetical protein